MNIQDWLDQWKLKLPAMSVETCFIQIADGPEIGLEKIQGGWLMAIRIGRISNKISLGVHMQLLQANSPFSPLAPIKLTADGTGEIVLVVEVQEGKVDILTINSWYGKLCQGSYYFRNLLETTAGGATANADRPALYVDRKHKLSYV